MKRVPWTEKGPVFRLAGDRGLLIEFGDAIDPEINDRVRALARLLEKETPEGVAEWIATYRSLIVVYDPLQTGADRVKEAVLRLLLKMPDLVLPAPETVMIPVCYGGELGPDLKFVAEHNGLDPAEVMKLHCEPVYRIYMLGFTPGFPFLGGLSERLVTPRLTSPRLSVPAGSVGIANDQTGIYPIASPGGWRLIGRTPLRLFDPGRANPVLFKAGDLLKFVPIPRDEFDRLAVREGSHGDV